MAGNQTMSWLSTELLQCDICLDSFKHPKWLDCGHSFCLECIKSYMKGKVLQSINCPTCRNETKLPKEGPDGLRNDFRAMKIEGLISEKYSKRTELANICNFCETNNTPTVANKYCVSCCKRFCDCCLSMHANNAIFQDHTIIDVATQSPRLSQKKSCGDHPNEISAFFCQTCDQLVCTLCLIGLHNGHTVDDVTTAAKKEKAKLVEIKKGVTDATNQTFGALKQACTDALAASEVAIKERMDVLIAEIRQQANFLLEEVRMLRTMKMQSIDGEWERSIARFNNCEELSEVVHLASNSSDANKLSDSLYSIALFVQSNTPLQMGSLEPRMLVREQQGDGVSFSVQSISETKETNEVAVVSESEDSIHEISRQSSHSFSESVASNSEPDTEHSNAQVRSAEVTHVQVMRPLRAKLRLIFCVNSMGDQLGKLNDPIGVGELLDGKLIVCEWANRRLQVFGLTGEPVRALLSGTISPQGIVVTLKGNILVSDSSQKKVFAFSPAGKTMSKSGIGKFKNPCGLAFSMNGNIIVSDTTDHSVTVYKNDQVVAFKMGGCQLGDQNSSYYFHNPLYVSSGPNNEILVSDSNNHCVKVFDSRGKFITRIGRQGSQDGELSFPRGLCVDVNGRVVVADHGNNRICAFNMRGEFLRHLLTRDDGIVSPFAVAITSKGQLAITESESRRAALKLFQIK